MAARDRTREVRGPTGWVIFAGSIMVIVGFLNFFYGLAAIVNDDVVVVGGHGAIIADLTAWGWVTLILAVVLVRPASGCSPVPSGRGSSACSSSPSTPSNRSGSSRPRPC